MKITFPKEYIPLDLLSNGDWKLRMSERATELAQAITIEDVLSFTKVI